MRTKRNHRSSLIVVLSLVLLMAMLTACSSAKTVEETKVSETVEVKEEVTEVETEVAETELEPTAEPTPELTAEPTAEPTPEPIVYEGIDMESTLSGEEWLQTFDGIITEPKVVILNDETGRKQIVENGDKVKFNPDTDYIAVYLPGEAQIASHYKGLRVEQSVAGENYDLLYLDVEVTRERRRQDAAIYVNVSGEEVELPFDFIPE